MSSELLPPSSMKTFWSENAPAVMPLGDVPGCSTASVDTSRPMFGSFSNESLVSVVPTVALVVCRSAPTAAVTSTVVVVDPTFSIALMVSAVPTSTFWDAILYTVKPCLLIVIV
jgi:hypothetical protein